MGFNVLPKTDVVIQGSTIPCVFNTSDFNDNNVLGGFEPDQVATLAIKTSLLTNPKTLKGKIVVIEGETWRVVTVVYGQTISHLKLISDNKA